MNYQDLVVTGSGDSTAHIWKAGALSDTGSHTGGRLQSSEESADSSDDGGDNLGGGGGDVMMRGLQVSTPLVVMSGKSFSIKTGQLEY